MIGSHMSTQFIEKVWMTVSLFIGLKWVELSWKFNIWVKCEFAAVWSQSLKSVTIVAMQFQLRWSVEYLSVKCFEQKCVFVHGAL